MCRVHICWSLSLETLQFLTEHLLPPIHARHLTAQQAHLFIPRESAQVREIAA
jgi:hypothetical protein